jgi:hypothetical protein
VESIVDASANSRLEGIKKPSQGSASLLVRALCGKQEMFFRHRSCSSLLEQKAFEEEGTKRRNGDRGETTSADQGTRASQTSEGRTAG